MLGAGALGRPRGMVQGGRKKEGSGWGTRVDIWQNQYNIVKFKNKIKLKKIDKCEYLNSLKKRERQRESLGQQGDPTSPS